MEGTWSVSLEEDGRVGVIIGMVSLERLFVIEGL